MTIKLNPKNCNHYPMLGLDSQVKYGGCWETISATMDQVIIKCIDCGEEVVIPLARENPDRFMSERRQRERAKDRDENHINMIQPKDPKTGKFNEEFGKHYGYNPFKTPAPKAQPQKTDAIDDMMAKKAEENIKLKPLKK